MGSGMARNLIQAGHELAAYNRTRSRAEALKGARIAETAAEAASGAEALITMVADDRALDEVIFAPGNIIESLPAGSVHISMKDRKFKLPVTVLIRSSSLRASPP